MLAVGCTSGDGESKPDVASAGRSTGGAEQPDDPAPGAATGPTGRLTFAAGGSIHRVNADGSALREVIPGSRGPESEWNAAPALSPDGSRLLFTRDFDVWIANADGSDARLFANVGEWQPAPGASNFSLGAQSVAWSPDGRHVLYVLARIGGSGVNQLWVMRADGSQRAMIHERGAEFLLPTWLDGERIALYEALYGGGGRMRVLRRTGEAEPDVLLPQAEGFSQTVAAGPEGRWLVGPFLREEAMMYGPPDALALVATGVSPTLSPDGRWLAYFVGDTLRIASVDGNDDHELVDLTPLGGRDRHFASACGLEAAPGCSYRPPLLSWGG